MSRAYPDNISRYRNIQGGRNDPRGQAGAFMRSHSPCLPDIQNGTPRVEVSDVDRSPLLLHDNLLLKHSPLVFQRSSTPVIEHLEVDRRFSPRRTASKDAYHTPQQLRSNSPRPSPLIEGCQDGRSTPHHKPSVFSGEEKSFLSQCSFLILGFVQRLFLLQILSDTSLLSRFSNSKKNVLQRFILFLMIPLICILLYQFGIPGSSLFYGTRTSDQIPAPHDRMTPVKQPISSEVDNRLQKEMEHKYSQMIERKWLEHLERMDRKWAEFAHNMKILETLVLQEVNNTKALVKQVAELKLKSDSRLSFDPSSAVAKIEKLTQKCLNLEEAVNGSVNCCQSQTLVKTEDLKVELSVLSQEFQQKLSRLSPLQTAVESTTKWEIEKLIKSVVDRYDADKIGIPDFALESAGGSIVTSRCSDTFPHGTSQFTLFGVPVWKARNSPRAAIQPQTHPGECWAMHGSEGTLAVLLSAAVIPKAFSLEHIPKMMAPSGIIDSAPKDFSIYGLDSEDDEEGDRLGSYTYLDDGHPLQTFNVTNLDGRVYSMVELHIESNYGNPDYTCIYRFRVHGTPI